MMYPLSKSFEVSSFIQDDNAAIELNFNVPQMSFQNAVATPFSKGERRSETL